MNHDCPECGGFGYTIEKNYTDGDTWVGCENCWIQAIDQDTIYQDTSVQPVYDIATLNRDFPVPASHANLESQ